MMGCTVQTTGLPGKIRRHTRRHIYLAKRKFIRDDIKLDHRLVVRKVRLRAERRP